MYVVTDSYSSAILRVLCFNCFMFFSNVRKDVIQFRPIMHRVMAYNVCYIFVYLLIFLLHLLSYRILSIAWLLHVEPFCNEPEVLYNFANVFLP